MFDNIRQFNEDLIKNNLKDLVRSSIEAPLNAALDHEADELVNADKYERSSAKWEKFVKWKKCVQLFTLFTIISILWREKR